MANIRNRVKNKYVIRQKKGISKMYGKSFVSGMGIGLAAGMVISAAMMPKKKIKSASGKLFKILGDVVDNFSGMLG